VNKQIIEQLQKEIYTDEALLTAIFYDNPILYEEYDENKLNSTHFGNNIWSFYFNIGRLITKNGGKILDDITVYSMIEKINKIDLYQNYNEFETMKELIIEIQDKKQNVLMYYENIKKYNLLRNLYDILGEKVLSINGNYNYKNLTSQQISSYWTYQIDSIILNNTENYFDEEFLLTDLEQEIEKIDQYTQQGLPFFDSRRLTEATNGWNNGELYIFGGFGGKGKTSFVLSKIILSCIEHQEKLVVIANEESIERFKKNLLITVMGNVTNEGFARQKINKGNFTIEEKNKLLKAVEWIKSTTNGNNKLITFVYLESYIISDVKKIIKKYSKQGIMKFVIDTGKPSEGRKDVKERWQIMTEDMKDLYKLCKTNANGFGVGIWVNVQLADSALKTRYLNEHSLGESKKMKNEASVVFMMRPVWDDELEEGKRELLCFRFVPTDKGYTKKEFKIPRHTDEKYYLLFTPKNRLGQDNNTGLPQIVYRVNFNKNKWTEVGLTYVIDDHNYQ